jgi:hypothetical protein
MWRGEKEGQPSLEAYIKDTVRWASISKEVLENEKGRDECKRLEKQIICILTKLYTYKRIKADYPEAYEQLLALDERWGVGGLKEEKTDDLCTSVEGVRARLK